MSRSLSLALATSLVLVCSNLIHAQDPTATNAAPVPDDLASLQAENATLKQEVSVQARTISELQAKLAQTGQQPSTAADNSTDTAAPAASTNAAPAGPMKALPLDDTNAVANAAAPGSPDAAAGPSRTYKVVKGDSLWKIAHKMYPGDTKNGVDKLQEANKDTIGGKPLKIGQVLIVPQ